MVRSMYAAIAGLRAHQQKMDVIGNNIANVNTYGYKASRVTFKDAMYQTLNGSANGDANRGGTNTSQIGYGSAVGTIDSLFTTAAMATTDFPLDCMIDGNGFFLTSPTMEGMDEIDTTGLEDAELMEVMQKFEFSRAGNFGFDGDGYLVDGQGNHVFGYEPSTDATVDNGVDLKKLSPIRVPVVDDKPVELTGISIAKNGVITGIQKGAADDGSDNKVVVVGQIATANVPNPNALEKMNGPYYKAKGNTGLITANTPGQNTGQLVPGSLEMSNTDLSKEFSEMITTQRGFQANSRIITVTDTMLEELVNLKR